VRLLIGLAQSLQDQCLHSISMACLSFTSTVLGKLGPIVDNAPLDSTPTIKETYNDLTRATVGTPLLGADFSGDGLFAPLGGEPEPGGLIRVNRCPGARLAEEWQACWRSNPRMEAACSAYCHDRHL